MDLARLIRVARGREPADLLLTNARVLDLYACDIIPADVAITGDRITGIAPPETDTYPAREVLDLHGSYLAPGLIDGNWLYGTGSREDIFDSVARGRSGICPAFTHELSPVTIRALAVLIYGASHKAAPKTALRSPAAPAGTGG